MTSVSDPLVGTLLDGRYEIRARVARGGMATVYRAMDRRLTREVAIKVMHEGLGDDQDFARKFDREARAAAKLSHPNIVSVFDQGVDLGRPYIVMEYVAGRTLRNLISREAPLDPLRALEITDQILSALVAAHESGLVHRDVKPENVLISHRGQLKVADFGLARAVTAQSSTATQGLLIGTVSYLPPELVTTGKADTRSDVYSTGIVLFEMLTGSKPHTGDTPIQVAYAHVHNDVPAPSTLCSHDWRTSRSGIPPYLDALVRAATRRERDERPDDARTMLGMVRTAREALSSGVMDDPSLTLQFSQTFAGSNEPTAVVAPPPPTPPTPPTPVSPHSTALHASRRIPVRPYSSRSQSASSPAMMDAYDRFEAPEREVVSAIPLPVAAEDEAPVRPAKSAKQAASTKQAASAKSAASSGAPRTLAARVRGLLSGANRPTSTPATPAPAAAKAPVVTAGTAPAAGKKVAPQPPIPDPVPARKPAAGPVRSTAHPSTAHQRTVFRRRRTLLIGLLLVLLAVGGGVGYWYAEGRWTTSPQFANQPVDQAVRAAQAADVTVTQEDAFDETVPAGAVISSDPAADTRLLRGSSVHLVVSRGPERFAMPEVAGKSRDEAQQALAGVNLKVGKVTESWNAEVPAGKVVEASAAPGDQLKRDTAIDLTVSKGPQPIKIEDWTGRSTTDAKAALEKAGFTVKVTSEYSNTPQGNVARQDPKNGAGMRGGTITLVDSKGPLMVKVPEVKAMSAQDARGVLEKAGFKVETTKAPNYVGLEAVSETNPAGGTEVAQGSTITLSLV
ncbi:Stk1 family PASTA domain-containing Ser/Thr kinase [Granulicoccus phenolivorans]|uniref:Stk1 family PASTA domain-containing Ser/Thr kinase n=1 Tax=Granulicoccus phenolivorans TaxID=266854 RepID=UPI000766F326|nr:Stk1 family PASTA domain-containing Ser/Thr kinase [Granulicoccus phenolivorans]